MIKYSSYKKTNLEWLGNIPSNWDLQKVGKFFLERSEKVDDQSFPPLSVTKSGVVDQLKDVAKTNDNENRKLVKKDDFVINSRSDRKGSSGIALRDGSVSLINIVLEPHFIQPKFIEYLFKSFYFKEEFFRNGKGIHWDLWTTRWEQFKNIYIPVPSKIEQQNIALFLTKKTKQIDSLIKKVEHNIHLLKEKEITLVNHYVTKGLKENIEMKDCRVNWIGKIPKNWTLSKVKRVSDLVTDGSHHSPVTTEKGKNYVTVSNISKYQSINFNSCSKISLDSFYRLEQEGCRPQKGDILITKDGTIGRGCIVDNDDFVFLSSIGLIRLKKEYDQFYFLQFLLSNGSIQEMFSNIRGSGITRLTINLIKNLPVLVPPINEQKLISKKIKEKVKPINTMIEMNKKKLELIKEYRQSLISSVVTGKIRITEEMM